MFKGAAADELSQEGEGRDFVQKGGIHIREIIQGLDQPAGEEVVCGIGGDILQELVGKELQDGQFVMQGGVEHAVRVFLVLEDVFFLAAAHAGPHAEGFFRRVAAELLIADDAPQEADVRGADAVMVIQVQAGEGAGEDPVDLVGREHFDDLRVEAVDALEDDDFAGLEMGGRGEVILLAGLKIVAGHEDFLAAEEAGDTVGQELDIQGFDGFKIPGAVELDGQILPVDEEIVHGDPAGGVAVHLQMHRQAGGKGGFAAGGGTGHQRHMLILLMDLFGDIVDGGFMQRFVHTDEIPEASVLDHDADVADVGNAENFTPVGTLGENFQVLGAVDIGRGVIEIGTGRQLQDEAAPELEEREDRNIAGGDGHGAVEVLPHAVDGIHGEGWDGAAGQQLHLVRLARFAEVLDGVLPGPDLAGELQIQFDDAAHLVLDADDVLAVQLHLGQADKDAVADGVFDADLLVRVEMAQGQEHHETEGALIDAAAFLVLQGEGRERAIMAQGIVQLADDTAGQGGQRSAGKSIQPDQTVPYGGPFRKFFLIV